MRVRFAQRNADTGADSIPRIGMRQLIDHPELARAFSGKVVFVGLTAVTELHDRLPTPVAPAIPISGIEINASAFETIAQGLFITDAGAVWVLLFSLALLAGAGLSFRYLPGWWAYLGAPGGAGRGAHHALRFLYPRPRLLLCHAGFGGLVRQPHRGGVLPACGAPQLAHRAGGPHALPAGHAICDARNAHAAFRHPGVERTDLPATRLPRRSASRWRR